MVRWRPSRPGRSGNGKDPHDHQPRGASDLEGDSGQPDCGVELYPAGSERNQGPSCGGVKRTRHSQRDLLSLLYDPPAGKKALKSGWAEPCPSYLRFRLLLSQIIDRISLLCENQWSRTHFRVGQIHGMRSYRPCHNRNRSLHEELASR